MIVTDKLKEFLTKFKNIKETSDGWDVQCPSYCHGSDGEDKHPSLRVTLSDTGKILMKCRVGCSTQSILESIGKEWKDLFLDEETQSLNLIYNKLPNIIPINEIVERHNYFKDIWKTNPVSIEHSKYLVNRNLKPELYLSLSSNTLMLLGLSVEDSLFYRGIGIPIRDELGNIKAIKIRRLNANGPRYIYLPSPFNIKKGNLFHYPLEFKFGETSTIYITEGEFKADYLTRCGYKCISIPGVSTWKLLPAELKDKVYSVVIAFDWIDIKTKSNVREQLIKFSEELIKLNIDVNIATWDDKYKGIDDYLINNSNPIDIISYTEFLGLEMDSKIHSLEPVELKDIKESSSDSIPIFPLEVFPPQLSDYYSQIAESMNCPVDFTGVVSLAQVGAAIGSSRAISIKNGWIEYPSIYSCVVASPGEAKTPVQSHLLTPMYELQSEVILARDKCYDLLPPWEAKKLPPPREFFTTNTTVEALVDRMVNNNRGLMIASDEILSWVNGLNQYRGGQGNDLQFFLSGWSGAMYKADRKTGNRTVSIINKTPLTILGSIQPRLLVQLGEYAKREDGFLDRFIFTYPKEKSVRLWTDREISNDKVLMWTQCIRRLYNLNVYDFKVLKFSDECKELWIEWHDKLELKKTNPIYPNYLRTYLSKLYCYCIRFCLILEYMNWVLTDKAESFKISLETLQKSIKLCDYFIYHYQRVRSFFNETKEQDSMLELLRWIWDDKFKGVGSAKDLIISRKSGLPRNINEIRKVFLIAQAYSLGEYFPEREGIRDVFVAQPKSKEMITEGRLF